MKDVRANGFEEMVYTIEDLLNLFIHIYYKKMLLVFLFTRFALKTKYISNYLFVNKVNSKGWSVK